MNIDPETLGFERVLSIGELVRDLGLIGEIVLAIRSFRPDLVLTHDPRTRFTIVEGITQMG